MHFLECLCVANDSFAASMSQKEDKAKTNDNPLIDETSTKVIIQFCIETLKVLYLQAKAVETKDHHERLAST